MFGIPIEYLMFGGIGFCLAWLMALAAMPAVHNRATRLARQRYDDVPLSIQEIRAEKDTIRAGFAAATRELELRMERLREKTVAHTTDLAKKNQLIERLKQEIDTITAALRESETREQSARDALREAKRGFADKDVTLGAAEGEITVLQRELASKDTALRAIEKEIATIRAELTNKSAALGAAEGEIASVTASLRESTRREQTARDELRETRLGFAGKDATLGAVEEQIASLERELAARDAALHARDHDLTTLRSEVAGKDAALNRAEREIAAIKAEIAALTKLLLQEASPLQTGQKASSPRVSEVVPFVPVSRPSPQTQAVEATVRPEPVQTQAEPKTTPTDPQPARQHTEPQAPRAPIDVIPAPTRLIPPTIPQSQQQNDDSVRRAWTEITDAAQRVDDRQPGTNQRLRALYAPLANSST